MYGLFDLGGIERGKRVLIHSGAGGVGIAAIQLAQYAGANLFVTVGTEDKREFLKRTFGLGDDRIIVGGLRGLCASLAVSFAKAGARHLAVISRSGYEDPKSKGVVKQIEDLGARIDLLIADVTRKDEIERAFNQTKLPVAGIVRDAMVLRGTWNFQRTSEELGLRLEFFTLLSSISGVVGTRGQANYAAGNVFLDVFALYRRQRGQPACSVDLGIIEDSGFLANNEGFAEKHFDSKVYYGINDRILSKTVHLSTLQQWTPTSDTHRPHRGWDVCDKHRYNECPGAYSIVRKDCC
ncbi:hypothetical protein F4780DRAFT_782210 [Xylariomycetidae sp. FL0641]|nr:hypothetical protein F4780DRAFT_782210 [Xylariomycetidae sp. FL0641]